MHELGHVFRLDLEGKDLRIIEDWAGVENGEWTVDAEEKFAKGLEQYMATRKAPTPELAGVFERFRNWVVEVYDRLRGRLDMEIPEEVMAVYDKMFTDDMVYEQRTVTTDMTDADQIGKLDPRSLNKEQHELIETAGLIKEVDDRMAVVDEAWQKAQDGINQSEGVSPRSAGNGHYLGNGMLYEKAGGKFYELMGDGSRGAEVSTKELRARGAEKVVPLGDAYRLQVEYQQLAAQKAELLDAKKQLTAKIGERERLDKGGADDPKVLYQAAADGDASVAGAEYSAEDLKAARTIWQEDGVKSPYFKDWFGDWEYQQQRTKLIGMEPILVDTRGFPHFDTVKELRDYVKTEFSVMLNDRVKNIDDGRVIYFEKSSIDKSTSHTDPKNLNYKIVTELPKILEQAVHLDSNKGKYDRSNIKLAHQYGAQVIIDGELLYLSIVVKEKYGEYGKGMYYDTFTVSNENLIKNPGASLGSNNPSPARNSTFNISRWLSEVNDHSVVVDGNGSPLIVFGVNFGDGKAIDNLNPTGGVFGRYDPQSRMNLDLEHNIRTLDITSGKSPDEMITIYRGAPSDQQNINSGDFVTTNKQLAIDYSGDGHVISKDVKLSELLDDQKEPGGEEYIYRPARSANVQDGGFQFNTIDVKGNSPQYYLNARNLIDEVDVNGRDIPTLKREGYDGVKTQDGFIVFDDSQIKSTNNRGTFSPTDPRKLYQDGGQMPLFPVGGYDQTSGFVPIGEVMDAGWNSEVSPLLDAMERAAMDPEVNQSFEGMDPETSQMLRGYLNDVRGDMAQVKHETVGWGNMMHDRALLNYNEQYGFDKLLNAVLPYQFFMTRSAANWFTRMWDRPAFLSFYARFKQLQNTYRNQYPERTRNKVWVPMGFLPEGMGDGVWLGYQNQLPTRHFVAGVSLRSNA